MSKSQSFHQFPLSTPRSNNRKGSPHPLCVASFVPPSVVRLSLPTLALILQTVFMFSLLWAPSNSLINISCNSFVSCSDHNLLILPRCHAMPSSGAGPATTAPDSAPRTEEWGLWLQGPKPVLATHSFQAQGTTQSPSLFCQVWGGQRVQAWTEQARQELLMGKFWQGVDTASALGALPLGPGLSSVLSIMIVRS